MVLVFCKSVSEIRIVGISEGNKCKDDSTAINLDTGIEGTFKDVFRINVIPSRTQSLFIDYFDRSLHLSANVSLAESFLIIYWHSNE